MSLPKQYSTAISYFDDVVQFLKTYEWIFNYPNTDILLNRVFEQFPADWIVFFKNINFTQLNNFSTGIISQDEPESLKAFIEKINSLKPQFLVKNQSIGARTTKNLKVSKKKYHEIELLSSTIHDVCEQVNAKQVIDIGSGLGYLPERLHEKYNYKIIGLEGNLEKYELAITRKLKSHQIKYYHHFVTPASGVAIKNFATPTENAVLTGLHACADLTIIAQKLFLELDFAKGLVIMPCCYHRLETFPDSNCSNDKFKNFPVSDALREIYCVRNGGGFLRRYFLRLACQQSVRSFCNMNEEQHKSHIDECLFRAILEEAAREENCHVSRNKRKTGRSALKDSDCAFDQYVKNLKNTHTLIPFTPKATTPPLLIDSQSFHEKMYEKYQRYKSHCYLIEALTALQMAIQSVCENLVLLDRVEFLREKGVVCEVQKVTDDRISPRCYALVATKV